MSGILEVDAHRLEHLRICILPDSTSFSEITLCKALSKAVHLVVSLDEELCCQIECHEVKLLGTDTIFWKMSGHSKC